MSDLSGLPDFQAFSSTATSAMFAPFGSGSYAALPQLLTVASDAEGNPKFSLELLERLGDLSASGQYAVLDFSLTGDFQLDAALVAARSSSPSATVKPLAVNNGFARLYPTTGEVVPTSDLLAPIALGWASSDYARWTTRLSADAGELIKGAIAGGSVLLGARVEYDAAGVAPRSPVTVEFKPVQMLDGLLAGKTGRQIATSDLVAAFTGSPQNFPLKITGTPSGDFAGAVVSRLAAAFGALTPSPGINDPAYVVFKDASQLPQDAVQWDLSQPAIGHQQWVLSLDVLTSLRAYVAKSGIGSLVKNVMVPPLQVGFCRIDFGANLPPNRLGVPAIGANVEVAANPPQRPSSISQQVTFTEPNDSGSIQFRLSPSEQLTYTLSGYAVAAAGQMVQQFTMPPQQRSDTWVHLAADDFPVTFSHVTSAARLLSLATLAIVLNYVLDGKSRQLQFALTPQASGVAMGMPRSATGALILVTATPADGGPALTLPPMAPGRIELDVTAFREYGPHSIDILGMPDSGAPLVLEFLSQEQADVAGSIPDQRFLTADQPSETWSYVVTSPFRAGYRYRKSAAMGAPAAAWSPLLSPFAPLVLDADGVMVTPSGNGSQPSTPQVPSGT
jgi:hypothetical protein